MVKDAADEFEERMQRARAEELEENETVFLENRQKEYEARYTSIELLEELLKPACSPTSQPFNATEAL